MNTHASTNVVGALTERNAACHPDGCGGLGKAADLELPFAKWCVCSAAPHMPVWQSWGVTANMLSVAGLLVRLAAAAFVAWSRRPIVTPIVVFLLFMTGIWLDNIDGTYARNYGEPSEVGACLDLGSDILTGLVMLVAIAYRVRRAGLLASVSWCAIAVMVAAVLAIAAVSVSALGCRASGVEDGDPLSLAYYARTDAICGNETLSILLNPETLATLLVPVLCGAWLLHDVIQLSRGHLAWQPAADPKRR